MTENKYDNKFVIDTIETKIIPIFGVNYYYIFYWLYKKQIKSIKPLYLKPLHYLLSRYFYIYLLWLLLAILPLKF